MPYRLEELVSLLNEQMGKLENRSTWARYQRLLTRIETARNDPRYASRIAKEGRKYGVFLGLVTQRPGRTHATIISQCSTLFAMRMANDRDQGIVRSAVSDAAASLLGFVPSLGLREVFAFGEGVSLPTRIRFGELEQQFIPRSEVSGRVRLEGKRGVDREFMHSVVERWRGATRGRSSETGQDGPSPFGGNSLGSIQQIAPLAPRENTVKQRCSARHGLDTTQLHNVMA